MAEERTAEDWRRSFLEDARDIWLLKAAIGKEIPGFVVRPIDLCDLERANRTCACKRSSAKSCNLRFDSACATLWHSAFHIGARVRSLSLVVFSVNCGTPRRRPLSYKRPFAACIRLASYM